MSTASVERWRTFAARAVQKTGNVVPVEFVLAIINAESDGIPSATRAEVKISDSSIGLMQLLSATARANGYTGEIGSKSDLSGLYDPETNILYGTKHLTALWKQLGNAEDTASAYNGGIRPNLGFGRIYMGANPVSICLARDSAGKCIKSRLVYAGQYGNAEYVSKVMASAHTFSTAQDLPTVTITAKRDGFTTASIVLVILFAFLFLFVTGAF